ISSSEFARLIENNLNEKSHDFAKLPGGELHTGNPTWFTSGVKRAGYNGITSAQFDRNQLDTQFTNALEPFRQTNTPLTWWTGPSTQPDGLGRMLQAHGFVHIRDMIGMACDLRQLPRLIPPTVEYIFEPVTNLTQLQTLMPLCMDTFGVPAADASLVLDIFNQLNFSVNSQWRPYMMRVNGRVIATSSLHFGGD